MSTFRERLNNSSYSPSGRPFSKKPLENDNEQVIGDPILDKQDNELEKEEEVLMSASIVKIRERSQDIVDHTSIVLYDSKHGYKTLNHEEVEMDGNFFKRLKSLGVGVYKTEDGCQTYFYLGEISFSKLIKLIDEKWNDDDDYIDERPLIETISDEIYTTLNRNPENCKLFASPMRNPCGVQDTLLRALIITKSFQYRTIEMLLKMIRNRNTAKTSESFNFGKQLLQHLRYVPKVFDSTAIYQLVFGEKIKNFDFKKWNPELREPFFEIIPELFLDLSLHSKITEIISGFMYHDEIFEKQSLHYSCLSVLQYFTLSTRKKQIMCEVLLKSIMNFDMENIHLVFKVVFCYLEKDVKSFLGVLCQIQNSLNMEKLEELDRASESVGRLNRCITKSFDVVVQFMRFNQEIAKSAFRQFLAIKTDENVESYSEFGFFQSLLILCYYEATGNVGDIFQLLKKHFNSGNPETIQSFFVKAMAFDQFLQRYQTSLTSLACQFVICSHICINQLGILLYKCLFVSPAVERESVFKYMSSHIEFEQNAAPLVLSIMKEMLSAEKLSRDFLKAFRRLVKNVDKLAQSDISVLPFYYVQLGQLFHFAGPFERCDALIKHGKGFVDYLQNNVFTTTDDRMVINISDLILDSDGNLKQNISFISLIQAVKEFSYYYFPNKSDCWKLISSILDAVINLPKFIAARDPTLQDFKSRCDNLFVTSEYIRVVLNLFHDCNIEENVEEKKLLYLLKNRFQLMYGYDEALVKIINQFVKTFQLPDVSNAMKKVPVVVYAVIPKKSKRVKTTNKVKMDKAASMKLQEKEKKELDMHYHRFAKDDDNSIEIAITSSQLSSYHTPLELEVVIKLIKLFDWKKDNSSILHLLKMLFTALQHSSSSFLMKASPRFVENLVECVIPVFKIIQVLVNEFKDAQQNETERSSEFAEESLKLCLKVFVFIFNRHYDVDYRQMIDNALIGSISNDNDSLNSYDNVCAYFLEFLDSLPSMENVADLLSLLDTFENVSSNMKNKLDDIVAITSLKMLSKSLLKLDDVTQKVLEHDEANGLIVASLYVGFRRDNEKIDAVLWLIWSHLLKLYNEEICKQSRFVIGREGDDEVIVGPYKGKAFPCVRSVFGWHKLLFKLFNDAVMFQLHIDNFETKRLEDFIIVWGKCCETFYVFVSIVKDPEAQTSVNLLKAVVREGNRFLSFFMGEKSSFAAILNEKSLLNSKNRMERIIEQIKIIQESTRLLVGIKSLKGKKYGKLRKIVIKTVEISERVNHKFYNAAAKHGLENLSSYDHVKPIDVKKRAEKILKKKMDQECDVPKKTNGYYGQHTFTVTKDCFMLKFLLKVVKNFAQCLTISSDVAPSDIDEWQISSLNRIMFECRVSMALIKPILFRKQFEMIALTNPFQELNVFRTVLQMNTNRFMLFINFETFLKCMSKRFYGRHIEHLILNGRFNVAVHKKQLIHNRYMFVLDLLIAKKVETFFQVLGKYFNHLNKTIAIFTAVQPHGFSWLQIYEEIELIKKENFKSIPSTLEGMIIFNIRVDGGYEEVSAVKTF
uniref:Uncharacterized protein n=1 Tax=Panagrolaimus sp. ES5 TaxID=591445 RepID=A0AC34FK31_9BILA